MSKCSEVDEFHRGVLPGSSNSLYGFDKTELVREALEEIVLRLLEQLAHLCGITRFKSAEKHVDE